MGGGQIGYNWQFSPIWVVGVEADFQGADEKEHSTLPSNFSGHTIGSLGTSATVSTVLDYQTKIDWFGTARLRGGYVWGNGNVLSYVTGGLAYGEVKLDGTNIVSGTAGTSNLIPSVVTQAFDHSNVNTGWVVGYGTEGRLVAPGWTWKVEGLYMDLGHLDATGSTVNTTVGSGSTFASTLTVRTTGGQITTHSHFTDGILRGGLNYKFY
jgi:outer membrane immunogenic protein